MDKKISREQLETLARAGMAAPSAVNAQPWEFVLVDDRATLDALAEQLPYAKMAKEAGGAVIVCGNLHTAREGIEQQYWIQDCSAATQNILLAVESMGLGAVWTGVYPKQDRVSIVTEILALPEYIIPLNVIPVGYPAAPSSPKDKFKPERLHWNRWS